MKRQPTKGTEIAALEAARNEQQVLAEGALLGERRVAWARLAMVAMFGVIANVEHKGSLAMIIVGSSYSVFAIVTLWRLNRTTATMGSARWIPVVFATIDFAFSTIQGLLAIRHSGTFSAGEPAIATAIMMSFAIARSPVHHVAYSTLLGIVSFSMITSYAGELRTVTPLFVLGGLVVLGFMILMTNIAVRRMFAELRKRDNLTRFLPRQVAERVLAHGAGSLAPVARLFVRRRSTQLITLP